MIGPTGVVNNGGYYVILVKDYFGPGRHDIVHAAFKKKRDAVAKMKMMAKVANTGLESKSWDMKIVKSEHLGKYLKTPPDGITMDIIEASASVAGSMGKTYAHEFSQATKVVSFVKNSMFVKSDTSIDLKSAVRSAIKKFGKKLLKHPLVRNELKQMQKHNATVASA